LSERRYDIVLQENKKHGNISVCISGTWEKSIIIRALVPANTVPGSVAIKVICYLGFKHITMTTKVP